MIREEWIRDRVQEIRRRVIGIKVFGQLADLNNPDELLVAAYGLGQHDEANRNSEYFNAMASFERNQTMRAEQAARALRAAIASTIP
jgi:hypothetical protein